VAYQRVCAHIERRLAGRAAIVTAVGVLVAGLLVIQFDPETFVAIRDALVRRVLFIDLGYVGTYLGVVAGVMVVEAGVLGWSPSSLARVLRPSRSARTDLCLAAIHILGWGAVVAAGISFGALWYWQMAVPHWLATDWSAGVPLSIRFAVVVILTDFLDYWHHRWVHSVRFLWEAHQYHHAATEFTLLTGNRLHAVEEISRALFTAVPLAVLGAPPVLFVTARWSLTVVELLQHSSVSWTYGWVGQWLIFSPAGHRTHHSIRPEHWNRNFGNLFVWWDRLFGTWMDPPAVPPPVGVQANRYNRRGVMTEYFLCLALSVRTFTRSIRSRSARRARRAVSRC
jgi:sterol desaturase/sphingolipid hydroxylase (fatty acid hydroxylase superfamily)